MAKLENTSEIFEMHSSWPVIMLHMPIPFSHITILVIFIRISKTPSKNSLITIPFAPIVFKIDPNRMENVTRPSVLGPARWAKFRTILISVDEKFDLCVL